MRITIDPSSRSYGDGIPNQNQNPNGNSSSSSSSSYRSATSLRRIHLDRSILTSSTGSSLIEMGHTKIICSVHGPRPITSSSLGTGGGAVAGGGSGGDDFHSGGVLNVELRYAPTFGTRAETKVVTSATNLDGYGGGGGASSSSTSSKETEIELSSRLHDALSPSIPLELLNKSVIDVFVMVLQDDGSVFAASVVAASMALCDAGVEVYDCVTSCTVALIPQSVVSRRNHGIDEGEGEDNDEGNDGMTSDSKYYMLVDPIEEELLAAEGSVTLAMMSSWKEVTFWDQRGRARLPPTVVKEAAELCKGGCTAMRKFMRQCLIQSSESVNASASASASANSGNGEDDAILM
eukprot:CAMPEP_0203672610 /NCGR_PEP_ID=MMETSP0090-20130426/8615_1 /ASSEMBLY_ACC=CAM_ASM_001088 /TAXON_ID=426623 /ORGANISM="Chaetoceros affinis, Strain CCMP159" /LENGTH=348 /DNA_ID=CAMNT_0050537949 /DNA_START=90 /DNA_END=1136 /DNA_ORIENTATION=+